MERETVIVDGKEVNAARFLAALHNNTQPLGLGFQQDIGRGITPEEAAQDLAKLDAFAFDYYHGRPLKTSADSNGIVHPGSRWLYDRDAGEGAFDRAVAQALLVEQAEPHAMKKTGGPADEPAAQSGVSR